MRRIIGVGLVLVVWLAVMGKAGGAGQAAPDWSTPPATALKRISQAGSAQNEPDFFSNLDCSLLDYRLVTSHTMQTGCFTETAFGLMDSGTGVVIFNGTDEGLPLLPPANQQALLPWPSAGGLLLVNANALGGSTLGLYKGVLSNLQDQRNLLGQLTSKQLTGAPDMQLKDGAGRLLTVNPQSLAFSDGGSWLVAENLAGSFVRINLASLETMPFATAYGSSGSPALLQSRVAVSRDGRFVAIDNETAGEFKVYDLADCAGAICKSHDYRSFVAQQVGGLRSLRHVRFMDDGLLSLEVTANDPAKDGIYLLAPRDKLDSLIGYLGMGDSYTSGEGTFDYQTGTDTPQNTCHLSVQSYPRLIAHDLFSSTGGRSVACSGAVIEDVGSRAKDYKGQVGGGMSWQNLQAEPATLASVMANFVPGYVSQQRFVGQYQPEVSTLGIGGNDIGFGDIVAQCVAPHISLHGITTTCFGSYEDRAELKQLADRTVGRWTYLYRQLRAESPGTRLYAVGYPQVAVADGNCALNVHLNHEELVFTADLIDYLNGDIKQAAAKAGVPYIDIGPALAGHRLCEAAGYNVAINGLTAGNDFGVLGINLLGRESYHPNALGHQLIEQYILKQTNNFQTQSTPVTGTPDDHKLLNKPPAKRPVKTRKPSQVLGSNKVKAGRKTTVHVSGGKTGSKPKSVHTVHLDGPDGPVIGGGSTDGNGDLDTEVNIPPSTEPGGHTVDVTGPDQSDGDEDVTQPIYVPVDDNDSDGDSLPDKSDSCPYAVNSGLDADQDGIDDACDAIIGPPPGGSTSTGSPAPSDIGGSVTPKDGSNLRRGSITVAANFNPGRGGGGPSRMLGTATASPFNTNGQQLGLAKPASVPKSKLLVINWLLWLGLFGLLWLLALLIYVFGRRLKQNLYQNGYGSATISS